MVVDNNIICSSTLSAFFANFVPLSALPRRKSGGAAAIGAKGEKPFSYLQANGFPTDNAPSTHLKYDIVDSKFMTGIHNNHKCNVPVGFGALGLVGAVLQGVVALVVMLIEGIWWALKKL
ncbi:hypothetical protein ACLI09_12445 [Flavobacterium sp. RHBU_24]|uniref:hypothetical protein n=1 Tax=Flavobacterium sp. RHBU_24 TaxID=3391185 RepID=UPI0039853A2E